VLVQKPLALSYVDAQATVDLARKVERLLFVDYTYRFLATLDVLRRSLVEIGACRRCDPSSTTSTARAEKTWFFDRQLSGGGALLDLGIHLIDLACG